MVSKSVLYRKLTFAPCLRRRAEWGNTGVMTFIVNQQGKVFEKSLGPQTGKIAKAINTYDPDDTWTLTR